MIDTALLLAGALTVASYFDASTKDETKLRGVVDALYRRVDWNWAQGGKPTLRQGWKPECGFLHYGWDGHNEGLLLYALALGSPTHPNPMGGQVSGDAWDGIPAARFFEEIHAEVVECYYNHPLAQEEIGYIGFADARGWQALGLDTLAQHEPRERP